MYTLDKNVSQHYFIIVRTKTFLHKKYLCFFYKIYHLGIKGKYKASAEYGKHSI